VFRDGRKNQHDARDEGRVFSKRPGYPIESIIAMQKTLENGIPEDANDSEPITYRQPSSVLVNFSSPEGRVNGASAVSVALKHNLKIFLRSLQFWAKSCKQNQHRTTIS
jgi:hypothetical protein